MTDYSCNKKIAVIGGGPAGMMAAGTAILYGADVTIFEHSDRLGKKLAITGKGRCNVTNNCDINDFLENVTKNPRFLYASLSAFPPSKTIEFFEDLGVSLKTERGNRVFPSDDKAKTIVDAMRKYASGAKIVYEHVSGISRTNDGLYIINKNSDLKFDSVILATGGRSYPKTGSDGSGYKLAVRLGHSVSELKPSLVPIESDDTICTDLMGLSLRNVGVKISDKDGKTVYSDFGELLFTHFGVSGPTILSASAKIKDLDVDSLTLYIDMKPALDEKTLDERILSDFKKNVNKNFSNSLSDLLPQKLISPFIEKVGIDPYKKVNSITKDERHRIVNLLKGFSIKLSALRPIDEAIITSGGINVKELNPKTMESKLSPGIFFAGEMIDTDAYTGGFNLQIAFSTGYIAGKSAAE